MGRVGIGTPAGRRFLKSKYKSFKGALSIDDIYAELEKEAKELGYSSYCIIDLRFIEGEWKVKYHLYP